MIDAALKMEGEESASIAQGFGAAIGGIGTEKFQIEAIATQNQYTNFFNSGQTISQRSNNSDDKRNCRYF